MGMAASQGRFLGLTARKTNVEYEGQQINQQRTALSNQSATYNNQLLGLSVPTAPSTDSFSKTSYAWTATDGTTTNTITNLVPDTSLGVNGYNIIYTKKGVETGGYATSDTDSLILSMTKIVSDNKTASNPADDTTTYDFTASTINGTKLARCSSSENTTLLKAWQTAHNNTTDTTTFYSYTNPTSGVVKYYAESDLLTLLSNDTNKKTGTSTTVAPTYDASNNQLTAGIVTTTTTGSSNEVPVYKTGTHSVSTPNLKANAIIDTDSSGRMTAITILDSSGKAGLSYTLDTSTTTDEAAYNDAMNKYEYNKNTYNKTMDDINAKISIIQIQDKSLELKLKQCDTEQSAISTELDAVKKVISKNVESSFKTFNA